MLYSQPVTKISAYDKQAAIVERVKHISIKLPMVQIISAHNCNATAGAS